MTLDGGVDGPAVAAFTPTIGHATTSPEVSRTPGCPPSTAIRSERVGE
jgi:hypothetical protein